MALHYEAELTKAMTMLASKGAVFFGQSIKAGGTLMHRTFRDVPQDRLIEMPVAENFQLGLCTGVALAGGLPVSVFPRINFLLEAISQLVSHLDRLPIYSHGRYKPKVIIRTSVATANPLNPGEQHLGDHTEAIRMMLKTVVVSQLVGAEQVVPAYERAMARDGSTLLVEYAQLYGG